MGAKLLGIVIENISNNVLKKTPLFASSDVNTAPLLLPLSILVKLNNQHVLVKFTKRTKGREGGRGENRQHFSVIPTLFSVAQTHMQSMLGVELKKIHFFFQLTLMKCSAIVIHSGLTWRNFSRQRATNYTKSENNYVIWRNM